MTWDFRFCGHPYSINTNKIQSTLDFRKILWGESLRLCVDFFLESMDSDPNR